MIITSYSVDNDKLFSKALEDAINKMGDLRSYFNIVAKDFYKSEKAIFKLKSPGNYPDFGGLNPNKATRYQGEWMTRKDAARLKKKKAFGFDYPLLKATGKLEASVTTSTSEGSVLDIKPTYMILGTSLKHGLYHQSDETRKKIPLRKFLFIGPEAKEYANSDQVGRLDRWLKELNLWVIKKLENK